MARLLYSVIFPVVFGVALVAASGEASACNTTTICLRWAADFVDNDFGEDYTLADDTPAAGARVSIIRPSPEPPLSMFLDDQGCAEFETQFALGHKMVVYADAVIGDPLVRVRPFRSVEDQNANQQYFWIVDVQGLAPGDVVYQTIVKDGDDPIVPMMAAATAVLQRFDALGLIAHAEEQLDLVYRADQGNAGCNCDGVAPEAIHIGPDAYREKFVMAHEMGHWIQAQWSGVGVGANAYSYEPVDADCQFAIEALFDENMNPIVGNGNSHGIRSAEWSSGALVEGYAHFLASVAFNDTAQEDGIFRYYKDIDLAMVPSYQDFVDDMSLVSLAGGAASGTLGGRNQWVANMCSADWNVPLQVATLDDEVTSEIDWMRFWWRFATEQDGLKPSLPQIMAFMAFVQSDYAWDDTNVWPKLRQALQVPASGMGVAYLSRFDAISAEMGVYNDGP